MIFSSHGALLFRGLEIRQDESDLVKQRALPDLMREFVGIVEEETKRMDEPVHPASVTYLDRTADFIIDLLSQLPTRRFFRPLVDDLQV